MKTKSLFKSSPIRYVEEIPIFSERNDYTENYETISKDHMDFLNQNGANPFISNELLEENEESTIKIIKKMSKPSQKILDVGVGLGAILEKFSELDCYGMDISFRYLNVAKKKNINVVYSLIEDMPYQDEVFDIIVCTDVLEHVIDLKLCCQKILACLNRDGVLIIRVPYKEDLSWYQSQDCPYKYVHLRTFDENLLRDLFEKTLHCKIIKIQKCSFMSYSNRFKFDYKKIPKGEIIYDKIVKLIDRCPLRIKKLIIKMLYLPIEINLVVTKTK